MYSVSYRSDSRKSSIIHYAFFFEPKLSRTLTGLDIHHVKTYIGSQRARNKPYIVIIIPFVSSRFVRSAVCSFLFMFPCFMLLSFACLFILFQHSFHRNSA